VIRVVAQRGESFLLEIGEGRGRVLDLRHGRLFPPMAIDSILARGYWQPFSGNPDAILARLEDVEDVVAAGEGQQTMSFAPSPREAATGAAGDLLRHG
jgi:hypothetical protein